MGTDNAGIITSGSARPIVSVTATAAGTVAPLSDPAKPSYEGLVSFTLTVPNNPAIVPGVWIYVANLQLENPGPGTRFLDTYAGDGTYRVTNTAQTTGGNMLVVYHERVPNPDYYSLYQNNNYVRDQDASSAAGVVSVVVGQSAPVNIADNVIADCSRSDITYRGAVNTNIVHNDISGAGMDALDLGGIYAWGEDIGSATSNSNVVISYNTVHDIVKGPAIYADNGNSGVKIEHNTVYNAKFGVQVSSGSINATVEYNTLDSASASIHSGTVTYYDPVNGWKNIVAGIRVGGTALYNTLGVIPDKFSLPTDPLYGFNVGIQSIPNGNNIVVAHTSNGAGGDSPNVQPPQLLDAKAFSGTAYIYEDLGPTLGTLFHTTRIHIIFGDSLPTQFSIQASNDAINWSNAQTGIPASSLVTVNGVSMFDTTINLISRYVRLLFTPANGSDVKVAQIEILGTNDLAAVSDTTYPAPNDLSVAMTARVANNGYAPVPALGDDATKFTPHDIYPNSYIFVDLGASVRIYAAATIDTGNFSLYYSNTTTGWITPTPGGVYARYLLYALAAGPIAGSVLDVPVLGSP